MERWPCEVLEDKDHIKVLQTELHTFQMSHLDFIDCDHHEWGLHNLDETVSRGLDEHVAPVGYTMETEVANRHVHLNTLVATSLSNLLSEALEQPVELCSATTLLLLGFKLVFIAVAILALPVTRLIELNVRCFAVELDILCLLFVADNDWVFEMDVDDNNQLMLARLEEQVLDIRE